MKPDTEKDKPAAGPMDPRKIDVEDDLENCVLYEVVEPHIGKITFNRPHRGNAMLVPDMNELLDAKLLQAQDDDEIKVIILTGAGKHFCSGEDTRRVPAETFGLKKGGRLPQSRRMRGIRRTYDTFQRGITWGDKIVIAACNGAVMGLGFELAFGCDLLIAASDAKFARRQSRMGFASFGFQMPIMLLKMGFNRGLEVLLTGRTVTPQELKDWGVANSVVPPERLLDEAMRYARAIALLPADGLMLARRAQHQFLHGIGISAYQNFTTIGHPLFTNIVWRDDEFNFLRERNRLGNREAWLHLEEMFSKLGFG